MIFHVLDKLLNSLAVGLSALGFRLVSLEVFRLVLEKMHTTLVLCNSFLGHLHLFTTTNALVDGVQSHIEIRVDRSDRFVSQLAKFVVALGARVI